MNYFMKNKDLGFIVKTSPNDFYKAVFDEENGWINVDDDEFTLFKGKVVHDDNEIWGIDYYSDSWAGVCFEQVSRIFIEYINQSSMMWSVIDLETGKQHEGGWRVIVPGAVDIVWDSDYPEEDYDEDISLGEFITNLLDEIIAPLTLN